MLSMPDGSDSGPNASGRLFGTGSMKKSNCVSSWLTRTERLRGAVFRDTPGVFWRVFLRVAGLRILTIKRGKFTSILIEDMRVDVLNSLLSCRELNKYFGEFLKPRPMLSHFLGGLAKTIKKNPRCKKFNSISILLFVYIMSCRESPEPTVEVVDKAC